MRKVALWFAYMLFSYRGKQCVCGFSELAHSHPHLEWDIDRYPCDKFTVPNGQDHLMTDSEAGGKSGAS